MNPLYSPLLSLLLQHNPPFYSTLFTAMSRPTLQLNTLANGDIVRRALAIASNTLLSGNYGIQEHRCVALLSTVCRKWEEYLRLCLHSTVILEYVSNERTVDDTWRKWLQNSLFRREARYLWMSNSGSVEYSSMQDHCKELRIVNKTGENTFEFANALFQIGFAASLWPGIRSLRFVGSFVASSGGFDDSAAEAASALIAQCLPGLTAIDHASCPVYSSSHLTEVIDRLACHYLQQLQSLSLTGTYPQHQLRLSAENLTKVEFDAPAIADRIEPSCIPVTQLHTLRITNMNCTFPWRNFAGTGSTRIEFTNLQRLELTFARNTSEPVPIGADLKRLQFPRLRHLHISRSFDAFTNFYSVFSPSSLDSFNALESMRYVEEVDTDIISSLSKLTLNTAKDAVALDPSWMAAIDRYLSTDSTVQNACIGGFPYAFTGAVCWPGLKQLTLEVYSIDWQSVGHLLAQLPSLWYLEVWYNHLQPFCSQPERQTEGAAPLLRTTATAEPLSTGLQELVVYIDDPWTVALDMATLCSLISRLPSLLKVKVPEDTVAEMEDYAQTNSRAFDTQPTFLRATFAT